MPLRFIRLITALVLAAMIGSAAPALSCVTTNVYVDPAGSDSTGDGSVGNPWKTVVHALSLASAGTVINLNNGTYAENATFSSLSGTTGCNIQLRSTSGQVGHIKTVYINNSNFLTIGPDLDISNQTSTAYPNGYGVHIDGTSHDVTVTTNTIHDLCHDGIFEQPTVGVNITIDHNTITKAQMSGINVNGNIGGAAGTGTTVTDNDISDTQQRPALTGGVFAACPAYAGGDDADWIRVFGGGHVIGTPGHGNNLHDIAHGTTANPTGAGEAHTDCFQSFSSTLTDTVIDSNTCRGSDTAAWTAWNIGVGDIQGTSVARLTYRNNVFANLLQGINFETNVSSLHVYNNTFDHISQEAIIYHQHIDPQSDVTNNVFFDVGAGSDGPIACADSHPPDYLTNDAVMRSGSVGTFCNACACPMSLSIAPDFVDNGDGTGSGANYHLGAASAIKAAGTSIGSFSKDKDNLDRPQWSAWSLGAFELLAPTPTPTATATPTVSATPTASATATPTVSATPTATITATPTASATATSTATATATATATPTASPTPGRGLLGILGW